MKKTKGFARFTLILTLMFMLGSSSVLADVSKQPSLKEIYKDYFDLGVAVNNRTLVTHAEIIKHHFNSITAENEMKPEALQRTARNFDFSSADRMVEFAQENGMKVRGHTLVWHAQTRDWFWRDGRNQLIYEKDEITAEDRALVQRRLEDHIEGVMSHFGDAVYAWDVVNEAVSDGGTIHRPDSPWYMILGDEFMKIAFRKAHEVNPNIILFYNDYNSDHGYKRGRTLQMLQELLDEGVPIHGMGLQGHWSVDGLTIAEIERSIRMYADLGLEIHITEMDVGMTGFTEEEQAERYRQLFEMFKRNSDVITSVTLWGVSDDASWRGDENPLLFGRDHQPKPAFWAIVDTDKPWYVNKAEYTKAAVLKDSTGQAVGELMPGTFNLADLDFDLAEVTALELEKGHLISFYAEENAQGDAVHFVSTKDFDGAAVAAQTKSLVVRAVQADNIALNKPADANFLADRAGRAVDGEPVSSWAPNAEPPYWISIDLEGTYLLSRWAVRLQGTSVLAGQVEESPLNAADFALQVSLDGENWQDVDVVEGNIKSVYDKDLNLVEARYVRLYVTKPTSLDHNQRLGVTNLKLRHSLAD